MAPATESTLDKSDRQSCFYECGGDKSTQEQDIRRAKEYWADYEKRENADQR